MKITFKAKILAEVKDTPEVVKGGLSISHVMAMLAIGEMQVELPHFIDEPTVILTDNKLLTGSKKGTLTLISLRKLYRQAKKYATWSIIKL